MTGWWCGDVTASSDAGDVRLELGAVPTRVRADSDAGDVRVTAAG